MAAPLSQARRSLSLRVNTLAILLAVVALGGSVSVALDRDRPAKPTGQADFSSLLDRLYREAARVPRPYAGLWKSAAIALGTAAGGLGIWLTVRLINGRRRLTRKDLMLGFLVVAAAYPLSFGPACWILSQNGFNRRPISVVYYPIIWLSNRSPQIAKLSAWYAEVGESERWKVSFEGNEMSWWIPGRGSMVPYRTVISCDFSFEPDEECPEAAADQSDLETAEID